MLENWCFWTMLLEKTLDSPLDCRKSNQSILKEINSEYSLEGLMLKLKLQYFGHLMQRTDLLKKTLILGNTEGRRRRGQENKMVGWHHQLDGHEFEQVWELVMDREAWRAAVHDVCKDLDMTHMTEWLNWSTQTDTNLHYNTCMNIFSKFFKGLKATKCES